MSRKQRKLGCEPVESVQHGPKPGSAIWWQENAGGRWLAGRVVRDLGNGCAAVKVGELGSRVGAYNADGVRVLAGPTSRLPSGIPESLVSRVSGRREPKPEESKP